MKMKLPKLPVLMRETLGPFEQMVLTAIMTAGNNAYGVPIYDKVCELANKRVNMGSLYITLDRLERKHLVSSRESDPRYEPRGKPKRFYKVEAEGKRLLEESVATGERVAEAFWSLGKWRAKRAK